MKKTVLLLSALACAVSAFAAEPPACSDPTVTSTVQELFWEQKLALGKVPTAADKGWKYFADFALVDVVSSGYDNGLKKRFCSASIGKGNRPIRVHYSAQLIEGGSGRYYVNADFSSLNPQMAVALREVIVGAINGR